MKFIKIKNNIFNVTEIKYAKYIGRRLILKIDVDIWEFENIDGYVWHAFEVFIENLDSTYYSWGSCFCFEDVVEESEKINHDHQKLCGNKCNPTES